MKLIVPDKVTRNDYIRIYATEVTSWDDFTDVIWQLFDVRPTEDNTVGQHCQMESIRKYGTCNGGVNLWGMKVKPINERIKKFKAAHPELF